MPRNDSKLESTIDEAILLYSSGDTEHAIRILKDAGLSDDSISRVLKNPGRRRRYINDFVEGY
jgi:hypothetical protein